MKGGARLDLLAPRLILGMIALMTNEKILIVEDERAVARGLDYGLSSEGFAVSWAATGQQALEIIREEPDLIILDIRLPDISGFDLCRQLRAGDYRQPILMLTALDDEVDKVLGLELGADDYMVKPYGMRELISRVRAMLRRAYGDLAPATAERLSFGDVVIDGEQRRVTRQGRPVDLTPTEYRLLHYLATRPNRAFSRTNLVEAI